MLKMIKNKSFRLKSTIFPIDNFAPIKENKSAWLSLDGIFSAHAKTPTIITVKRQAHETAPPYFASVISPSAPTLLPTEKKRYEEKRTPKKLKILDKIKACR